MIKETPPLKQSLPRAHKYKAVLRHNKPDMLRAGMMLPTLTLSGEGIGRKLRKDGASFLSLIASLGSSSSCHTAAHPAFSPFGFAAPVLSRVPSPLCSHGSCSPLSEHRWCLSHLPHPPVCLRLPAPHRCVTTSGLVPPSHSAAPAAGMTFVTLLPG